MDFSTPSPMDAARSAAIPHHDDPHRDDGIVSRSPALCDVLERLERVAPIDTTVLITGETGTGKELMARVLHRRSRRAARPPSPSTSPIEEALDEAQGRVSGPAGATARLGVPASTREAKIKRLKINKLRYRAVRSDA